MHPLFADNRRMKRALYFVLMCWIALQSVLVQAHEVEESLHQLAHAVQVADQLATDADHDEPCSVAVCCHPVGFFYTSVKLGGDRLTCSPPSTVLPLKSAHALDDIDRPKWPFAAPCVAGV